MEIDILAASKAFKVSRPTIYRKINSGELSKLPNGKLDHVEVLRVFGEPSARKKPEKKFSDVSSLHEKLHNEKESLYREKIQLLEAQLQEARTREDWLRDKVDTLTDTVKLLQAPPPQRRGLLSRLFGASLRRQTNRQ